MKLKRITIHNIASIADAEIDFVASPLADTPLFLIAGPTGAGKSIILDSVCLALYARAPRLTRFKTDEKYEDSTLVGVEKEDDRNVGVDANRQLMRRSTVECFAKLLFEGNDGNDYEAQWHLHRSRNKATGKFQKEERTLTLLKTGETWTKKADFEGKVQEVVGMKYEQFCRTSLLAQGEFTRFLQSKSDEKAEILERLTGIDIYSAVGRKIAEHAKAASDAYDRCCQAVAGISLLSDEEKAAVAEAIDVRKKRIEEVKAEADAADAKRKWIADNATFEAQCVEARRRADNLKTAMESDEFKQRRQLVADYDRSASARVYLSQRDKARADAAALKKELPGLERSLEDADGKGKALEGDICLINKALDAATKRLVAIDKPALDCRLKKLNDARVLVSGLDGQRKLIDTHAETIAESRKKLKAAQERISVEKAEYDSADTDFRDCSALYAQMEMSVGNAAKELRSKLVVGAECPVCGQRVGQLLADEHFQSVLEPVRVRKVNAEERLRKAATTLAVTQKEVAQQSGEIDRTTKKLEKARADYASMVEKASTACRDAETAVDIDAVNNALAVVAGKLREAAQAQTECDTQRRRFDDTNKLLAATKDAIAEITARLSERRAALANADKTAAESEAALAEFFAANPQIGEAALVNLSQTSRARIDSERDYCQRIMADADKSAGALASVEKMLENHRANRPALADADTADSLQAVVAEKRAEADALLQSNALDAQRLADDKKQAEAHASALVAAEKARAEKDKWDTLCKYLGDREGKQFRKVAQSFILSHLLNIANGYLCRFSDRYTLTCQPGSLVILVEDTHNPGVSQSANILSGGESFMVSLSLALALSRLNAADNGVDTLFIDEGFGTLSDECLTNVMDTLEALHQMGGRRVGIISHVDELSHRIPVQVRVERVDATRSEVEVVDTCGYAD